MNTQEHTTTDEYITDFPDSTQAVLRKVRQTIKKITPESKEKISYGIPTFTLNGKNLVHFGGYDKFVSFYPGAEPIEVFENDLKNYKTSKGTVQFPLDKPIPYDLIAKMTQFAVESRQ